MGRNENAEKIIKSKDRVKQHGEVFTPKHIVSDMISLPGMNEAIKEFETTVLEPACGEGIFIVEILKKRLKRVKEECKKDLTCYENLALLSLTTLYGIELLEDNAQKCVINIFETFSGDYNNFAISIDKKIKKKVLDSAKTIITANIVQGNFLTKLTTEDKPIIFSEWRVIKQKKLVKYLQIERTEFTLEEIIKEENHNSGNICRKTENEKSVQLAFFDLFDAQDVLPRIEEKKPKVVKYKYKAVKLVNVYKEEMEEVSDEGGNLKKN
ncbi:N-6 DNA methylase [Clostridium tetani]|uniref:N-6 DNA methylase n=1 Tax=Clostridium tetani TaxID=1513 RepID=UPI0013E989B4|nr:N-6 DNA methylase [Clostridium tetani]